MTDQKEEDNSIQSSKGCVNRLLPATPELVNYFINLLILQPLSASM